MQRVFRIRTVFVLVQQIGVQHGQLEIVLGGHAGAVKAESEQICGRLRVSDLCPRDGNRAFFLQVIRQHIGIQRLRPGQTVLLLRIHELCLQPADIHFPADRQQQLRGAVLISAGQQDAVLIGGTGRKLRGKADKAEQHHQCRQGE